MMQPALFAAVPVAFADGYAYEPEFLSREEEAALVEALRHLPLAPAQYRQYLANRRIVSYGGRYDFSAKRLEAGEPIAEFLHPLRERVAAWLGCRAQDFTHALVAEYSPGAALGWHRDVADFERVAGVSLVSACRMRFRPYPPRPREKSLAVEVEPRSIYRLEREARWGWQHSLPPVKALRYSITFRSLRKER